jgi:hypothetical protein
LCLRVLNDSEEKNRLAEDKLGLITL